MKEARNHAGIHPPLGAYTHQIEMSGNIRWLTLSGQVGMTLNGLLSEDIGKQFEEALINIKKT
ncbi:hypothetical protein ACYSNR_16495 [Enterococcus sp. LJL128]|uniref:hypothetical protein n=1 Tax=Enterococcus sp. LJL51 TaxID=3416656 RepID=UPI003CF4BE8C